MWEADEEKLGEVDSPFGERIYNCECETLGLRPGLTLKELNALGCGCCDGDLYPGRGWMCPRLDRIRRELNA